MFAICSDLDETSDAATYFEQMRFLNTTEETSIGVGVGLEVGNSIYFDMPPGHFSYWNATERERERIRALIRSGHIDCLHSFGDLAATRAHATRALEELSRHRCELKVWIDHAVAPTNFGSDIMQGHGDEPGHPAYHSDLTLAYGIRYIWRGRVTSVIGQDRSATLRGIIDPQHVLASTRTLTKEAAKHALARCGSVKYRLHATNRTVTPARLRDGAANVFEILRCQPHWMGTSGADRADRIHEVLVPRFLDRLVERRGSCILYTHLGKLGGGQQFSPAAVAAFRCLADYQRAGKILVTTTRRLLDSVQARSSSASGSGAQPSSWSRLTFPSL